MKFTDEYFASGKEIADSQLVSGAVLFVFIVLLNLILLLDWFGYLSIA